MKSLLLSAAVLALALIVQGCAVYATPYGYGAPQYYYYGPGSRYGIGFAYRPYGYNGYYGHYYYRRGPHYFGWGGRHWHR